MQKTICALGIRSRFNGFIQLEPKVFFSHTLRRVTPGKRKDISQIMRHAVRTHP